MGTKGNPHYVAFGNLRIERTRYSGNFIAGVSKS